MPIRFLILVLAVCFSPLPTFAEDAKPFAIPGTVAFTQSVLVSGLQGPWAINWGPDNMLWVTERTAGRIDRIDPKSGQVKPAITLTDLATKSGQDGLLGMALDPGLGKGNGHDFVYTAYTHFDPARRADPAVKDPASPYLHMYAKIIRLSYDAASGTLSNPVILIDGLPAGADHDSGRMKIGPDGKLYYTIGERGNDQLANWCTPIEAQRLPTADEMAAKDYFSYQGKSLRMNLDGTIPADNPVLNGVQSHIYTYGHRNMQGISFGPDSTLYAAEHGPKTDDEINILKPGGNYGWPHVAGYRDNKAYQYARWADATKPCASLKFSDLAIDPSVPTENETDWKEPFIEPIATLFTVPSDWNFSDPKCGNIPFICWPTVAPSSILAYRPAKGGIPGFDNALLVTTLKRGSLYRLPLSADGQTISGPVERYFQTENRYRDIEIGPDGRTFYIATDPGGLHETLTGGVSDKIDNPGAILVFTYKGN